MERADGEGRMEKQKRCGVWIESGEFKYTV